MNRPYENKAFQTLDIINQLFEAKVSKISVLLRHSKRNYTDNPNLEPFMRLTSEGRDISFNFGKNLPKQLPPKLYSSFIGRCIETAYLIDKGFTQAHAIPLPHTENQDLLAPFYIRNRDQVIEHLDETGDHGFLRQWFDHQIDEKVIERPGNVVKKICSFMIDCLNHQDGNRLTLCVSHDWNIYPIKEMVLKQPHEQFGDVGYLEGVLFFKKHDQYFGMGLGSDPVPLP